MQTLDLTPCRLQPYKHQVVGIEKLLEHPYFLLADEMGAGKTKQVIDTICILALTGLINRVIVVCPAAVRNVWFDPELGELSKHMWINVSAWITEYHASTRKWTWFIKDPAEQPKLKIVITNYDFIRKADRLKPLMDLADSKTLLVLDESSAVKSYRAIQTAACFRLRQKCGRVILLNGTPIANNPGDIFAQALIMNPAILACKSYFHFRARYAFMGGWQNKQIIGWRGLDDLQKRMAPYVLRRLKEQCLDLPPKLDSVTLTATLTPATWKVYKEMRDEMVAWLNGSTLSMASQAIVKAIRLSQITSGFIGGLEEQDQFVEDAPDWIEGIKTDVKPEPFKGPVQEIGREKLNVFMDWFQEQLEADPNMKLLIWCRFRPEVERLFFELFNGKNLKVELGKIWGGQKRNEREDALRLLDPRTAPKGPAVVIGTPASGSMGLNLTAAHTVVYMSNDYSLKTRLQSEDRVHRPGQTFPVSYFDIIATGPTGQKTIDHTVVKALKNKHEIANFTTSAWLSALEE